MSNDKRVALLAIMVSNTQSIEKLNQILHEYRNYIIGRMGLPYPEKDVCIISVALDAPQDIISALSVNVGNLDGVSSKTVYSNF